MLIDFRQEISATENSHKPLDGTLDTILMHRIGLGTNASDVMHAFTGGVPEAAAATGSKMPYHMIIEKDGSVVQCLGLSVRGLHAWKWNPRSIGIGAIGDFRRAAPSAAQWRSAITLCALLAYPQQWKIYGHDEVPEGSTDPYKKCPGDKWDMAEFRLEVLTAGITEADVNDFWRYVRC